MCLCDGKEEGEAKPLCEAGTLGFGSHPFLEDRTQVIPLGFGQGWVVGVERGHRWSSIGREWGRVEGTSIAALVALRVHSKTIIRGQRKLDLKRFRRTIEGHTGVQKHTHLSAGVI